MDEEDPREEGATTLSEPEAGSVPVVGHSVGVDCTGAAIDGVEVGVDGREVDPTEA